MKTFTFIAILGISLSAKCLPPEAIKGTTDKDIGATFKEAFKGIPVKLHADNGLIYNGTAKGSLASSSYTILLDKECNTSGECFKIKGFVSNGEKSALNAKVDLNTYTMTIPSGTKFEVIKGDDERWNHTGPMPDCGESPSINQKIINSQMKPMDDAIKSGKL